MNDIKVSLSRALKITRALIQNCINMKQKYGHFVFYHQFFRYFSSYNSNDLNLINTYTSRLTKSSFYQERANWIVFNFSKLKALIDVRRVFRQIFPQNTLDMVPASLHSSVFSNVPSQRVECVTFPLPQDSRPRRQRYKREQSKEVPQH